MPARRRGKSGRPMFGGFYQGRRVLITGHTGFKGGWLSLWLKHLGAVVHGVSLPPPTNPNLHETIRAFAFDRLLALWYNYNQLLLHMLAGIPAEDLDSTITIGDKPPVAIRQLIPDYFAHMENHERQARKIIQA